MREMKTAGPNVWTIMWIVGWSAILFIGGMTLQEAMDKAEQQDSTPIVRVIGFCVKGVMMNISSQGASQQEMQEELPKVAAWCAQEWEDFDAWVDAEIARQK